MIDANRSLGEILGTNYGEVQCHKETMQDAVEALEKQIPKKPEYFEGDIYMRRGWRYKCRVCGWMIGRNIFDEDILTSNDNYCPNCGQAIDWSEVES